MSITKLNTTLPQGKDIDKDEVYREKRKQTIEALTVRFRESVKSKGPIKDMSVKDVNDIFFDNLLPGVYGSCYNEIIEEFLFSSEYFEDSLQPILEGYWSLVGDLQEHIQALLLDGRTDENNFNYKRSTADYLNARLTSICERTTIVNDVHRLRGHLAKVDKRISNNDTQVDEIKTSVNSLKKDIYGMPDSNENLGIKDQIDKLSKKLSDISNTSDQIMPNIISLVGIFSSIIVVILSLITTSSSWLLNASNASILIAFVVPSGIITLAICALTALIRPMINNQSDNRCEKETKGKKCSLIYFFQRWSIWICISVVASMFVCGTVHYCQAKSNEQSQQEHYIVKYLPALETTNDSNDTVDSDPNVANEELYIIQEIFLPTGEKFDNKIFFTEDDISEDGYLYYCLLHKQFEN